MQKQAPTLGRLLVMVGFALSCFGLLLFLWLAFGGPIPLKPKGYRFKASFAEATSLAHEADVTISGVRVGKVKSLEENKSGRTTAEIELDTKYAPLPRDAKAILRQKTLLGETYVELTPGTSSAPKLKENGMLPVSQVSPTVELDEIFRAFDDRTREAFRSWMQSLAAGTKGRGRDISDALGNLAPFAEDTSNILRILNSQQGAVQRLVRNTGTVFGALSERDGELRDLITNSNTVFRTTAQRDQQLKQTFVVLPTFERESRTTLARLARFAQAANPLVTQLRPAARELSPTLTDLSRLAPDLKGLFHDLNPLIDASRRGFPALQRFLDDLRPLLGQLDPLLRSLNPILQEVGLYPQELSAFFSNTVATTEATDTPGGGNKVVHYLRTTNPVNAETLAVYPKRIGSNRPNAYHHPGDMLDVGRGGIKVYEDRQCGRNSPQLAPVGTLPPPLGDLLPQQLRDLVNELVIAGEPAPPCVKEGPFSAIGSKQEVTQYPHVRADAPAP